jgi:hypothetical protein
MNKKCHFFSKGKQKNDKYPSAEFLYSVSLEDYNRVLANYDRIYDRVNIALAFCGVMLVVILSNIDFKVTISWNAYSRLEEITVEMYYLFAFLSVALIVVAIIKLLLLSRSKEMQAFDSSCIKKESLYKEKIEDVALWITSKYINVINDIREKTKKKQKSFSTAILQIIIALLAYVVSMIIHNGGLL